MLKRIWIGFALALLLGMAVEFNRGNPPSTTEPVQVDDASGRRLLLFIIDSLSIPNFESMPNLKAFAEGGFYAPVEPCLERITYVCVKETLTGRTAFTLFGLFQNFGVGTTDPGDNLLRDAKAAGRTVAMVTAGDLKPFKGDADTRDVFKKGPSTKEERTAKERAQDADVLLYHWIWHDTAAHHHRVGTKKYKRSVKRADKLVADILEWLPEDMDLIVAGDHGHGPDGRHVQGMDIPTVVIAKSPNIAPAVLTERIPISAIRYLSGAVTGLYSDQIDWQPEWVDWLTDRVGPDAKALVASGSSRAAPGMPFAAVAVCLLILANATAGGRRWWLAGIAAMAAVMGAGFEAWMAVYHFAGPYPRMHTVLHWVPLAAAALGFIAMRRPAGAMVGATVTSGALLVCLFPVVHHYGVLKNLGNLMSPLLVAATVAAVARPHWGRRIAVAAAGLLAAWVFHKLGDFRIFNLEITRYRGALWLKEYPTLTPLAIGAMAAGIHAVVERAQGWKRGAWALAAGAGASGLISLPVYAYAAFTAAIAASFGWRRPSHARLLSLAFAWAAPFMFKEFQLYGLYATVSIVAAGLWIVRTADHAPITRWASGLIVALGAYMGLAWTFGLTSGGVDFTFAIAWLPGRLHEQFWWIIALVTTYKCMAHLPLIVIVAQRLFGPQASNVINTAVGFTLMRYAFIAVFSLAWLIAADEQAGGMRLAAMLQDGFFWLIVGLTLAGMVRLGPKIARKESTA